MKLATQVVRTPDSGGTEEGMGCLHVCSVVLLPPHYLAAVHKKWQHEMLTSGDHVHRTQDG